MIFPAVRLSAGSSESQSKARVLSSNAGNKLSPANSKSWIRTGTCWCLRSRCG